MVRKRVVLDSNIIISAEIFGGKPEQVLKLGISKEIGLIISPTIIAEVGDVLSKKFSFSPEKIAILEQKLKKSFELVYPKETIEILEDDDDNRVLETAQEGGCDFIVSGDSDLLALGTYKTIKILTPSDFLDLLEIN